MTTLQPPEEVIASLNFTGGFPSSKDFVPSLIMTIAYGLTLPLLVYRLISSRSRTTILIRPALFACCRIATFAMRADMAQNPYSLDVLIAQLVLVSVGFLLILEPLVALWQRSMACVCPAGTEPRWVKHLTRAAQFCLLAALVTGILATTQTSSSFDDAGRVVATSRSLRHASYILSFLVAAITAVLILATAVMFHIPIFRTVFLLVPTTCLTLAAAYRVGQTFSLGGEAEIRQPVMFWVCQMFFEFVAYLSFIVISIPDAFPTIMFGVSRRTMSRTVDVAEKGGHGAEPEDVVGEGPMEEMEEVPRQARVQRLRSVSF